MIRTVLALIGLLMIGWVPGFAQIMELHTKAGGTQSFDLTKVDSITFISGFSYFEGFDTSATGWTKVAGPGNMQIVTGVFKHPSTGSSDWCEYAYGVKTFDNAIYEVDINVDSTAVSTQFSWRAPSLAELSGTGGAYAARFNNSNLAPGTAGHFILEKFDPAGRSILLDVPQHFYGLNHLTIIDQGSSLTVSINGVSYGTIDVSGYTPVSPGYLFFVGGDQGGGDFFDNMIVR